MKNLIAICTACLALMQTTPAGASIINLPGLQVEARQEIFLGKFQMFANPHHATNLSCDIATTLTLDTAALNGKIATLENTVIGACELAVNPDTRFFRIEKTKTVCGTNYYSGERYTNTGVEKITIVDHRGRTCRDLVDATIIIRVLKNNNQDSELLFSDDSLIAEETAN